MNLIEQLELWEKGELLQGKLMIAIGILFLIAFVFIFQSQNVFLKGTLIPLGFLLLVLIGYGGYILYSRPAHVKKSMALYLQSEEESIQKEIEKHAKDNKTGNTLIKYVYPTFILLSAIALLFISSLYFKGMTIGFILLFSATFIIDSGFVSRSNEVITILNQL